MTDLSKREKREKKKGERGNCCQSKVSKAIYDSRDRPPQQIDFLLLNVKIIFFKYDINANVCISLPY